MRFFTIPDLHHLVLAFFLGLIGALIVYLSFRYGAAGNPDRDAEPIDSPPTLKEGSDNPVPPVLVFLYAGVLLSILLYVVLFILSGKAF
jgi:hypothetical protein